MRLGRYGSFPVSLGGAIPTVQILEEDYLNATGSATTKELDGLMACESLAYARMMAYGFSIIELYKNQQDPNKMTVHLERWEKIYGLTHSPDMTESERRAAMSRRIRYLYLDPTRLNIEAFVTEIFGAAGLVGVYCDTYDTYHSGYFPGGLDLSAVDGPVFQDGYHAATNDGDWFSSTIATVRIVLDYDQFEPADFEARLVQLDLLNDWLPAWTAWTVGSESPWTLDSSLPEESLDFAYLS